MKSAIMLMVLCLVSFNAFGQDVPAQGQQEATAVEGQQEATAVEGQQEATAVEGQQEATAVEGQAAQPDEQAKPIVVEKGGVLVESPVTVKVNVPEQQAPVVVVNPTIEFPKEIKVKENRTWCARHPVGCTFIIIGVTGAVTTGGFVLADQLGAFDRTNSVTYR